MLKLKNGATTKLKSVLTFFSILIFVCACQPTPPHHSYDLSSDERDWLEQFFTGLMLQNRGIYTLYGSKPMTSFVLDYHTDEEIQAYYDQMTEEEKKTAIYVEDYQLTKNWEKWEQVRSRFPMTKFLLFKRNDAYDDKSAFVYFVDPLKVARTMSENYSIFREQAGFDFDPLKEAYNIEKGSHFWSEIRKNPVISGLLYGFGAKNSLVFYWKNWGVSEQCLEFPNCTEAHPSDRLVDGKSTIDNLTLPAFMSFFQEDEIIDLYKKERKTIQTDYKGKDFLTHTLQKLTAN